MKYRTLGKSELRISEISFGCMSLQGSHAENAALLQQAAEGGITLFDTADLYDKGENEVSVGKAFKHNRQSIRLATKVGNQWRPDGSGWDWNSSKAYILEAAEKSLKRLQTDYIDLYQLHGGTIEDPIDETIEAFELLKQQGKIREYGISSIRPNVIRAYVQKSGIASVMLQYSLLDRRPEEEILGFLQAHQIGVLARGSLAQGMLAGKPPQKYLNYSAEDVQKALTALGAAAGAEALGQAAVQYALHHRAVSSAVLGIRTPEQLAEALAAATATPLALEKVEELQQSLHPLVYEAHR